MKTFKFAREDGDIVLCMEDNPGEMTIERLNEFQVYLLQDADMGSTLEDLNRRLDKMDQFLAAGKIGEARLERENLNYGVYFLFNKIDLKCRALASLVISHNGAKFEKNDESLLELSRLLAHDLTSDERDAIIEHVRGKFAGR